MRRQGSRASAPKTRGDAPLRRAGPPLGFPLRRTRTLRWDRTLRRDRDTR